MSKKPHKNEAVAKRSFSGEVKRRFRILKRRFVWGGQSLIQLKWELWAVDRPTGNRPITEDHPAQEKRSRHESDKEPWLREMDRFYHCHRIQPQQRVKCQWLAPKAGSVAWLNH
jgi:hypothetical protein